MKSQTKYLPYGRQCIDAEDIAAVKKVLKSDWLTTGPENKCFEAALSDVTNSSFAISCSSGTAALHLSMLALGIGKGDAVIVPSLTFAATANVVRFVNGEVIFADVDPETGLLTEESLINALNNTDNKLNVKAVLPVHMNGQCIDLEKISKVANENNLTIIEDASHAIGTEYLASGGEKIPIGSCDYSLMTNFSFHPVKTIAAGEGGAVTTNNEEVAETLFRYRNHGIVKDNEKFFNHELAIDEEENINPWYYEIHELGLNYRLSDIHSALGLSQLMKLPGFVEKRRFLASKYDEYLKEIFPIVHPIKKVNNSHSAWHLYVIHIELEKINISRGTLMNKLLEVGVGTQVHYIPLHLQPYYMHRYGKISLPDSESYYSKCLSLPLYVSMEEDDVSYVVEKLTHILKGK